VPAEPKEKFVHRILRLLLVAVAALALAACTITSDGPLTSADEAAAPLPDAFTYFPYQRADSAYVRSSDGPAHFTRQGGDYVSVDVPDSHGPLTVRFIRLDDENFLLAATTGTAPAATYGFARYDDGVLSLTLSPDKSTTAALRRERARVMPQERTALTELTVNRGSDAITVRTRAALDYLGRMYVGGRLPMSPATVGFVSLDDTAALPSRLVPSGNDWIEVP
jgi:hypothetical protein